MKDHKGGFTEYNSFTLANEFENLENCLHYP